MREKEYYLKHISSGDNGKEAKEFYSHCFEKYNSVWGGDAWFTPISLLDGLHDDKEAGLIKCISDWKWHGTKDAKSDIISKISGRIEANWDISNQYSCLANFGFLPSGLNPWRGGYDNENNRSRLGDFPDLFFECVKCYLENETLDASGKLGYSQIEKDKLIEYEWWFIEIGCKKDDLGKWNDSAWKNFTKHMRLKGSFVDINYQVVKLFDHEIGSPFPKLPNIDKSKKYTTDEIVDELSKDPVIIDCLTKIKIVWSNRAELLAQTMYVSENDK